MKPERFFIALIVAVSAVVLWAYFEAASDCRKSGGKPVRGADNWIECIKA